MTINLRQTDPRWSHVLIGDSPCTIGRWGCTICSLAMALGDFHNREVNPAAAARFWTFTLNGKIIWTQTHFNGMRFLWRYYSLDKDVIREHVTDDKKAVVAQVNGNHWVYLKGITDAGEYVIVDPIDGMEYQSLPGKYIITGFATFEMTPMDEQPVPEWAKDEWDWCKENGVLDGTRPADGITRAEQAVVAKRLYDMLNK